ncbi:SsrA-binding protein SmpB [Desulfobotulus mexicanus]|uniref:SsrA-binding protein n=1 Tax=Desulfobotulus mexicanus TaxID=2586642 RepID=A0A5Q4VBB2_9BACT|nr:SsrA-binding protein SmpB [Desulfobotulus mexicanus]TYT75034.1 SsrA-binding protein SmpB [Desulfobotulus mexicanus]
MSGTKIITDNRKARHNYTFEDVMETGIVLTGTEVKSLRNGQVNLKDAYAQIKNGEVFLMQMHISPYTHAYYNNHDPLRTRKLLLHKYEIVKLIGKTKEKGYSLIPAKLYFKQGKVKVALALARGKKTYDKRHAIKEREAKVTMGRLNRQKHGSDD